MTRIVRLARRKILIGSLLETMGLLLGGLSAAGLLALALTTIGAEGGWGRGLFLIWLSVVLVVLLWKVGGALFTLASHRTFIRRLEAVHPEYRNEISTAEYLTTHPEESKTLGFSPDLVRAVLQDVESFPDPRWEELGIGFAAKRKGLLACGAGVLAFAIVSFLLPAQVFRVMQDWALGRELAGSISWKTVKLPDRLQIPIGREVSIGPASTGAEVPLDWGSLEENSKVEFVARGPGGAWKWLGSLQKSSDPGASSNLQLKVEGPLDLYASVGGARGNLCHIEPVYPPAVVGFEAVAVYPDYMDRDPQTFRGAKAIEAFEGSRLALSWTANNDLAAATFELYSDTRALLARIPLDNWNGSKTVRTEINFLVNGAGRLLLLDRFGQKGIESDVRFLTTQDRPPEAVILSPTREMALPQDLRVDIETLVSDDIALAMVERVYRIDTGLPGGAEIREILAASGTIGAATSHLLKHTLDLTAADLWPGDQVAYWIEATDYRGEAPGLVGRSETHIVRFPTVDESLDEMAALRSESTDGLQELLEEQKEIGRQFKEIRQDLQRNLSSRGDPDKQWENQKRLSETLDRQSEVERQLSQVADQLDESLKRLSEDNQLTLRTLEKFERVQELMDEVLTDETKRIIQEIQETLKRLQKEELQPDALEETEMELAEFEKQLDRQLELLENLWMEQELEALRDQVQELADRQEELKEATTDLLSEEEKQELAEKEKTEESEPTLADQMDNLESEAERLAEEFAEEKSEDSSKADKKETPETPQPDAETESEEASPEKGKEEASEDTNEENQTPSENQEPKDESQQSDEGKQSSPQEEPSEPQNADASEEGEQSESEPQEGGLPEQKDVLAQRQEQLSEDTKRALDDLKRLAERAKEENHPSAEQMEQMAQSPQQESIPSDQQSAERNLRRDQPKRAAQKQSSASKQLAQMSEMLGACCSGSDQSMEESIAKMKEILERAFILSEESETSDLEVARFKPLPEWPNPGKMSGFGQRMGLYKQEALRLSELFGEVAEGNPFADFEVVRRLDTAARNWKENTRVMEESPPLPVSVRSHQSVAQVNLAIERLLDSISQSQSNCQSGSAGMEGYFRGLKQILSEQKRLNQETQEAMDQQGGSQPDPQSDGQPGMSLQEKMQRMADQQRQTRQMLEELDQRYQNLNQRAGNLEGVGEDMQAVEKELEEGRLNEQVVQTQKKIEQRLLDAEKSLHNQGFKKSRRALKAGEEPLAPEVESAESSEEELQADLARLLRNDLSDVPPHWRDRVRAYYDSLLRMNPQVP